MEQREQQAILTIALMAAFADGGKDERERAAIKRIADGLGRDGGLDVPAIYQDVLLKRRSLEDAAQVLDSSETRQLAYEMAVCVCDADDVQSDAERTFLDGLRRTLNLDAGAAAAFTRQADEIAATPIGVAAGAAGTAGTAGAAGAASAAGASSQPAADGRLVAAQAPDSAALDKSILNHSILNGALELLPQSLASMAIIPLQMKMVYAIGKAHGYELDRGHIRDLLATLGVGLTSQYVEDIGRKLIGGLLKKVGGRMVGGLGRAATGAAFSFATTYALGHVAKRYYASGRTISMEQLKQTFTSLVGEAKALQPRYAGEIEQKARTIDMAQLAALVKSPAI
jgi:uncharacterized protein (DUF697 family)/tellurite resistance protein